MRPDPLHALSNAAARAILDLVDVERTPVEDAPDDAAVARFAMGLADETTREACVRAVVRYPGFSARVATFRRRLDEQTGGDRLVDRALELARSTDRLLSEGRWSDAARPLARDLDLVWAAWLQADATGRSEEVEALCRALTVPLLEIGAWDEIASLLAAGQRAADRLARPRLRSWLLSFEGVVAARRGDLDRARQVWWERVRLNREIGNPVGEADALLDLAAQRQTAGEDDAFRALAEETDRALAACGRPDMEAWFVAMLGVDRLRAGDPVTAESHARRALELIAGRASVDGELTVQLSAARTLAGCGRAAEAAGVLLRMLERCRESGRAASAAFVLAELAPLMEAAGRLALAEECARVAVSVHEGLGTRYAAGVRADLSRFLGESLQPEGGPVGWEDAVASLLPQLVEFRTTSAG